MSMISWIFVFTLVHSLEIIISL